MPARRFAVLVLAACAWLSHDALLSVDAQMPAAERIWSRPLLHAHNSYPEDGRWSDRIERALATGLRPLAIEQDVAWAVGPDGVGRSVVSHEATLGGQEPALETYFFERLTPLMREALRSPRPETWPLVVLHLDFKTNEPAHHRAVWELLGRYEAWLTTALRTDDDRPQPLRRGPLLVLTENGDGQAATFYQQVPPGARLRLFGTVPAVKLTDSTDRAVQARAAVTAPVEQLIPAGVTNYRRWVNFSWAVIEEGGPERAGDWLVAEGQRLTALVSRARALGLWVRFYTLNGHEPAAGRGWTAAYNFGSPVAVEPRWRAAIAAGVDFIATDQYEDFASVLAGTSPSGR
jgi:hypothetical protein